MGPWHRHLPQAVRERAVAQDPPRRGGISQDGNAWLYLTDGQYTRESRYLVQENQQWPTSPPALPESYHVLVAGNGDLVHLARVPLHSSTRCSRSRRAVTSS